MPVNVDNINKTIARIRQNQNFAFDMSDWGGSAYEQVRDAEGHACGTSACIAGFAVLASDKVKVVQETIEFWDGQKDISLTVDHLDFTSLRLKDDDDYDYSNGTKAEIIARDYLGITEQQARILFIPVYPGFYGENREYFYPPEFMQATADQAILVLEHLRDTGKVDWRVSGIKSEQRDRYWTAYEKYEHSYMAVCA